VDPVGFLIELPLPLQLLAYALVMLVGIVVALALTILIAIVFFEGPLSGGAIWDLDAMFLFILIPIVWVFTSRIVLTGYDLTAPIAPFQVLLAGLIVVLVPVALIVLEPPQWLPARMPSYQRSFPAWFGLVISLFFLTEAFTAVAVLLAQLGLIMFDPPLVGATAVGQPARAAAWNSVESILIWNLLDMIPSLKVPETLGWQLTNEIAGGLAGLLVLIYKVVVILPIVAFVAAHLRPPTPAEQAAKEAAEAERLAKAEQDDRVRRQQAAGGTGPMDRDAADPVDGLE
jgi:hypothetical protein